MLKKPKLRWMDVNLTAKIYQSLLHRAIENVIKRVFFSGVFKQTKIAKDTMAQGVYATNMEIEMLKKELALEQARLAKVANGERISPPRVGAVQIRMFLMKNISSPSSIKTATRLRSQ